VVKRSLSLHANFEKSLLKYQKFLENNGYPGEVAWVTPDDILIGSGPMIYVRSPVSEKNNTLVRLLFESGIVQKTGVLFDTLCEADGVSFCYAWVPHSVEQAEEALMPEGLKLSARTGVSKLPAQTVRGWLRWFYLRLRFWKLQRRKKGLFHE
jgi:hypothetical protein